MWKTHWREHSNPGIDKEREPPERRGRARNTAAQTEVVRGTASQIVMHSTHRLSKLREPVVTNNM